MTIKEYLLRQRKFIIDEMADLISNFPEDEELSQAELVRMALEIASKVTEIYNNGFDDAIKAIDECDSTLLKRKLTPHMN